MEDKTAYRSLYKSLLRLDIDKFHSEIKMKGQFFDQKSQQKYKYKIFDYVLIYGRKSKEILVL